MKQFKLSISSTRAVANHLNKGIKQAKLKFMGCFLQATVINNGRCRMVNEDGKIQFHLMASTEPERSYAPLNQTIMSGMPVKK